MGTLDDWRGRGLGVGRGVDDVIEVRGCLRGGGETEEGTGVVPGAPGKLDLFLWV
jgi:hypothetical protein